MDAVLVVERELMQSMALLPLMKRGKRMFLAVAESDQSARAR